MRRRYLAIWHFLTDLASIATSRERLKDKLREPLYRNAIYLMVSSAFTSGLGFIFWIIAARFYTTHDVGLASAAISSLRMLALFATLGLDYAIIRFLPDTDRDSNDTLLTTPNDRTTDSPNRSLVGKRASSLINSCLTLSGLAGIVFALIFIAGLDLWSPALIFLQQRPIFLVTFIAATGSLAMTLVLGRSYIARRMAILNLTHNAILQLLKIALVILLAIFFASFGIVASWAVGQVLALLVGVFLFLPRAQTGYHAFPAIDTKAVGKMMKFSFANYIAVLLWYAPHFILPLMVINLIGADANAYFYIVWAIGGLIWAISEGTSFSLFAEGSHEEQQLPRDIGRSLKLAFLILVPTIALVFLIGGKLLLLFGPEYSHNGTKLLWILALSALPLAFNEINFGMKRAQKSLKIVLLMTLFITADTLGLGWFLLPRMGILGAGVAWIVSQTVVSLVIVFLQLRSPRRQLPQ